MPDLHNQLDDYEPDVDEIEEEEEEADEQVEEEGEGAGGEETEDTEEEEDDEETTLEDLDALLELNEDDLEEGDDEEVTEDDLETKDDEEEDPQNILEEFDEDEEEEEAEEFDAEAFENKSREEQDKQIFLELKDEETWADWCDRAEELHGDEAMDFAVMCAREGLEPKDLAEKGIYSLGDMREKIENLEKDLDPEAILLRDPNDPEAVAEFKENYLGIPSDREGYSEALFKDTIYEGDAEGQKRIIDEALEKSLSRNQVRYDAVKETEAVAELQRREEKEAREYQRENVETLKKVFGDNLRPVMKGLLNVIKTNSNGKAFYEEFKNSDAVNSAHFYRFIFDLINPAMSTKDLSVLVNSDGSNPKYRQINIKGHKSSALQKRLDDIQNSKYYDNKYKGAEHSKSVRNKHMRLRKAAVELYEEIEKRKSM